MTLEILKHEKIASTVEEGLKAVDEEKTDVEKEVDAPMDSRNLPSVINVIKHSNQPQDRFVLKSYS